MRPASLPLRVAVVLLAAAPAGGLDVARAQDGAEDVTIYRCTDAAGRVSIGDVPCPPSARQEVRSMVRPVDGTPPPAAPVPATPPAPQPQPQPQPVQYVVRAPAQPLYECVRPDGSTYESDTGIGEQHWMPAWNGGWLHGGHGGRRPGHGRTAGRGTSVRQGDGLSAPPVSRISIPNDPPRPDPGPAPGPRPRPPHGVAWAGGTPGYWVQDACHALPRAEACARLRDRRDDIRRRFFNAQQRERDTLRIEERGLNARIDEDCRT